MAASSHPGSPSSASSSFLPLIAESPEQLLRPYRKRQISLFLSLPRATSTHNVSQTNHQSCCYCYQHRRWHRVVPTNRSRRLCVPDSFTCSLRTFGIRHLLLSVPGGRNHLRCRCYRLRLSPCLRRYHSYGSSRSLHNSLFYRRWVSNPYHLPKCHWSWDPHQYPS